MIEPRLSIILKRTSDNKFRNDFIKYLSTLNFDEFEILLNHYLTVIITLIGKLPKPKFLSKLWFRNIYLKYKYNNLFYMFYDANFEFVIKVNANLDYKNTIRDKIFEKRNEIVSNVEETNKLLQIFYDKQESNLTPTKKDFIKFNSLIVNNIYSSKELEILLNELDKK